MAEKFEVEPLIEVLCGFQPSSPHERLIGLAAFGAWLHWPNGPKMVVEARSVGAALVIRSLLRGKLQPIVSVSTDIDEVMKRYLGPKLVTDILLDREYKQDPFFVEYDVLSDEHQLATATAEFIVRAPRLPKPSLNRCRYFIAKGGFAAPFVAPEVCPPRAFSTSKKAWFHYGAVAPFLLAARICKIPFVDLSPDSQGALAKMSRYAGQDSFLRFFGVAKSIQRSLRERLDGTADSVVDFVDLPRSLSEIEPDLKEFSAAQLKLMKSYSVENAAKIRIR